MATGPLTQVSDVVVPEIFTPYSQQLTTDKTRLVQSGALVLSDFLNNALAGGGLTFNVPSFRDLDNEAENVSTDDVADSIALSESGGTPAFPGSFNDAIPKKIETDTEIAVRLNRNQHWSQAQLAGDLAGAQPVAAIASRVSGYWSRRLQAAYVAVWQGVSKDNAANDSGDYANDVAGTSFVDGTTNFTADALIDTTLTMGDSLDELTMMMVDSVVFGRMQKLNLIDFIPDARGEVLIPTYHNRQVIVDDSLPSGTQVVRGDGSAGATGMHETWLFGAGSTMWGSAGLTADEATAVSMLQLAGNGGGQQVLHSRVRWAIHPEGHAYVGTPANGGPGNGAGANDFNNAGSWDRRRPERKQIKFARLITRES